MFEDISEAPQRSGIRGFINRHFGKIYDADQAVDEIKIYSIVFVFLAGLGAFLAFRVGPGALIVAGVLLALTVLVRLFKSRAAAICLLAIEILSVLSPHLMSILWAAFAFRLVQATFAYHRFSRVVEKAVPPAAFPPPPSAPPAPSEPPA